VLLGCEARGLLSPITGIVVDAAEKAGTEAAEEDGAMDTPAPPVGAAAAEDDDDD
jgi:hypothetical protein